MKTITLKSNDELIVNVTNSQYFIRIQDHFFYGEFSITVYNTTTKEYSHIKGKPCDRLQFNQSILRMHYSSESSICKISLWIIDSSICNSDLIHYSGIISAYLELFNISYSFDACYFFESSTKPKITSDKPHYLNVKLYYISDNDTMTEKIINNNISNFAVSELSILSAHHNRISTSYHLSITTDLKYTDFTNKDSFFKNCEGNYCHDHNIISPGFVVKRDVVWYIWLGIYLPPIFLLTLGLSLMMIVPRKDTALFTSSKPLMSEASKYSILSLY